jgi:rod shape-determining protein MreB
MRTDSAYTMPFSEMTATSDVPPPMSSTIEPRASLTGIVYAESVRIGGDRFDEAITNYVRRNYGILIGEATAERIKIEIGSAYPGQQVREMSVKGRNLSEGVPRSFTLNSNEILEAMQEPLQGIVQAVKKALEQTPPELGADVADRGIVLTGGGAMLKNLDKRIRQETGLPVSIAEDPLASVVLGTGKMLTEFRLLRRIAIE